MAHVPVLLQEVLTYLAPQAGEVFLDGTVGSGGHAAAIAARLGATGRLIGLDQDAEALPKAQAALAAVPARVDLMALNFRYLDQALDSLGIPAVDGILFDLGLHSDQLESSGRGFSFLRDEPLQMTMKSAVATDELTAKDIVNDWQEESLVAIFKGFGEEPYAERIAEAIVQARAAGEIARTGQLVAIIAQAVPAWYKRRRLHFATRTFQALRLAVNDELGALAAGLERGFARLRPGGRLGVISFHSLESRLVKHFGRSQQAAGHEFLTKHAVKPTRAEILANHRARSAELRVVKKLF